MLKMVYLIIVAIVAGGCDSSGSGAPGPRELEFVREIVRPDTTPGTAWIGRSKDLTYDTSSGHLLAVNLDEKFVFEVDTTGELVRTYGRQGEGPGELKNPLGIVSTANAVLVIDLGNMKLARFPRGRDGPPLETRLEHYYYDFAGGPAGRLYGIPGWEGEAITIFDSVGRRVEGIGDRESLPGSCSHCLLSPLGRGFLIVDRAAPELTVLDRTGAVRRRVPLSGVSVMREWLEEGAEILGTRPDVVGGKNWISDVEVANDSTILLALTPPQPFERGWELWRVDLSRDVITRYRYDHAEAGSEIAVDWPRVFTMLVREGAIREYRIPEDR